MELLFTSIAINQNLSVNKISNIQYENIFGYLLIIVCVICLLVFAIGNIIINIRYYKSIYDNC
jgi:hypothetical protein